ncbi:MAG: LysR family transcriptional regulator [Deltaproteobacteria bacterium]
MNYDWLFSFVEFAEHTNFTRAAEALHISQPALHVQVKKLTEAVGRPLYLKEGRNLRLTPEGERLAAFGRQVMAQGEDLVAELSGAPTGPLVLASGQGALVYLLGAAIRRFPKHRWPLRLKTLGGPAAIEEVRAAQAHLAVVATNAPPDDLVRQPLCRVGQVVVVPRDHRLARRRRLRVQDLAGEPLVVPPRGRPHRSMLEHMFASNDVELEVAVEATGWAPLLAFAKLGVGLTVVNDFCAAPRGMKAIPLRGAPPVQYHALHRPLPRSASFKSLEAMLRLLRTELTRA